MGVHVTFIRLADTLPGVFLARVFAEHTGEVEEAALTLGANPWQAFPRATPPGGVANM